MRIDVAGDLPAITSYTIDLPKVNLSGMTHVEGWTRVLGDNPLSALGVGFQDEDGNSVGEAITLSRENDWTYNRIALTEAYKLRDVSRLTLSIIKSADDSEGVVLLNGLWAVNYDSIDWQPMSRIDWRIERETRRLVIIPMYTAGIYQSRSRYFSQGHTSYGLSIENVVRIIAGKDPAALENDTEETEVDPWFIICRATELGYSSQSGGRETDPENRRQQATLWAGRSIQASRGFKTLSNIRRVHR